MSGVQIINVPGQGDIEFPADMSDDQIAAVIKRNLLAPEQKRMGVRPMAPGSLRPDTADLPYSVGGKVTDATGSPALGTAANAVTDVVTDPLTYLGGAAGKLLKPAIEIGAKKLMWSALKPSQFARKSGDAEKAVQTLLDKGYNVSEGGVEKMTQAIDKLDNHLDVAIANAPSVTTRNALQPLKDVFAKYRYGGERVANYEEINGEIAKYLDHPEVRQALNISAEKAQAMKRAYYREVGDKGYGMGLKPDAERDAKKGIARGLASELERVAPEVAPINAEMSPLINARDLARDRALVAANRNPLGFGAFFNPTQWPIWLLDRNELGKSILARSMYSGVAPVSGGLGAASGAGIGSILQQYAQ